MTAVTLEKVLSTRDVTLTKLSTIFTAIAYVYFWVWFGFGIARTKAVENSVFALFAVLMLSDQLFHCWTWYVLPRMSRLTAHELQSPFRIAMITTKTPGEPESLLQHTLACMLAQDYTGTYDVWLADESPTASMITWCMANGVRTCTRKGATQYHNNTWPRRTKCKEGNLAFFYDTYGYELYDIVYQFDSDHAPTPTYISSSIAGFYDPKIGYMAFPSLMSENKSWIGRARSCVESYYYGPYQASFNYDPKDGSYLMPNCVGSHYAVRTAALKSIGGLGPELDEDLSTTMMFMSHGWKGVYAMDTYAVGHGPETFACGMKQEFQWSRSAILIYTRWRKTVHPTYTHFTPSLWIRASTTIYWYFSYVMWMVWVIGSSVAGLYANWCTDADQACYFSLINIVLRTLPAAILAFGHVTWCRRKGWLRWKNKDDLPPVFSLTEWVYKMVRVVWMTAGVLAGLQELVTTRSSEFAVTKKGSGDVHQLNIAVLTPLILLFGVLCFLFGIQFAWKDPRDMGVTLYVFICCTSVAVLIGFIQIMHFIENGFASIGNTLAHSMVCTLLFGTVISLGVVHSDVIFTPAAANLFVPYFTFNYEWQIMSGIYAVCCSYAVTLAMFL